MRSSTTESPDARARSRGVTLFELVVVMGIVAILMSVGIPSYKYVTTANRIASEINGFLGDLQYARSEAIREGRTVSVCVSSNAAASPPTCSSSSTWQTGWVVFADVNGDGTFNAGGGDLVLRTQSGFTGTDTFIASPSLAAVTFNREGFAPGVPALELITLHSATTANASYDRCLSMTIIGKMTVLANNQTGNGSTCL